MPLKKVFEIIDEANQNAKRQEQQYRNTAQTASIYMSTSLRRDTAAQTASIYMSTSLRRDEVGSFLHDAFVWS